MALLLVATLAQAQEVDYSRPLSAIERGALFPGSAQLKAGEEVVSSNCASCHGQDGMAADPALPNLAAQRTIYLYRRAQSFRKAGGTNPDMHRTSQYLDDDALLKASMFYANQEYPARPEPATEPWLEDDDPLRATRAATAGCASCHGPNGNSRIPGMPSLTAQHPDTFFAAMKAYQAGERSHNMMQMLSSSLDEEKIRSMGVFYALQEPARTQVTAAGDASAGQAASEPCASCHGFDGNTDQASVPTLAGQDPVYLVAAMKSYLDGQRDHAAMQGAMTGVSAQAMANMAAWYASQEPQARNIKPPLGTRDWLVRCQRCHGEEGNSPDPRTPSLAGQNAVYLEEQIRAFASGERSNRIMHAMSEPLKGADIERLAAYYEARTPDRVIYLDLPCEEPGEN